MSRNQIRLFCFFRAEGIVFKEQSGLLVRQKSHNPRVFAMAVLWAKIKINLSLG